MKNSLKALSASVLAATLLAPTAQAGVSANVALTTDYVWRGVSQNGEDPALQGGFDYAHDSGFYVGAWAANVSFGGASTELDLYAGWSTEFENGLGLDFGIIEYTYHGSDIADGNDFTEYYGSVSYAGFGVTYYAGDEFDDNIEVSYGYDFEGPGISIGATYGDYDTYNYYQVGVSGSFGGESDIGWDVSYWDTDIDDDEASEGRVVLTISKEF